MKDEPEVVKQLLDYRNPLTAIEGYLYCCPCYKVDVHAKTTGGFELSAILLTAADCNTTVTRY